MILQKGNLVIRAAVPGDAGILCEWWNDGAVMAHAGFPMGLNTTEEEIIGKINADSEQSRHLILEIDGIPVGETDAGAN